MMPPAEGLPWYVAQTKPRQERVAHANLLRQSYRVYLPWLKVLKQSRNRQAIAFEPLFPRYLFFQPCDITHSVAPVRSTLGVASVVRFGGMLAAMREDKLDSIRDFERRQNAADVAELSALLPGKTVVVTAGALAGLHGLVAMVSRQRVVVLMQLLGEETRVGFAPGALRLAA